MTISVPDAGGRGWSLPYTGAGATSAALASACAVNDLIYCAININAGATINGASPTVTDSVNTGAYTPIGTPYYDSTNHVWAQDYYKVCNAVGTPTITVGSTTALGSGSGGGAIAMRLSGFTGLPTLNPVNVLQTTGTSGSVVSPTFTIGYNPEGLVCVDGGATAYHDTNGGSWTWGYPSGGASYGHFTIGSTTIGTTSTFTVTADAGLATGWYCRSASFYNGAIVSGKPPLQILLDDPLHTTASDQLILGTTEDDHTGEHLRASMIKLRQWAADLNTMTASLFDVTQTLGDAALVLTIASPRVVYQNATLTANRIITLPSTGVLDGMKFKVIRRATTPGAFTLTINDPLSGRNIVLPISVNGWAHFRAVGPAEWLCEAASIAL